MIRACARRVGPLDVDALGPVWELQREAERAVVEALDTLRKAGYSWADLAKRAGVTKQALAQWRARRSAVNDS